jgi:hypothetical protein
MLGYFQISTYRITHSESVVPKLLGASQIYYLQHTLKSESERVSYVQHVAGIRGMNKRGSPTLLGTRTQNFSYATIYFIAGPEE